MMIPDMCQMMCSPCASHLTDLANSGPRGHQPTARDLPASEDQAGPNTTHDPNSHIHPSSGHRDWGPFAGPLFDACQMLLLTWTGKKQAGPKKGPAGAPKPGPAKDPGDGLAGLAVSCLQQLISTAGSVEKVGALGDSLGCVHCQSSKGNRSMAKVARCERLGFDPGCQSCV